MKLIFVCGPYRAATDYEMEQNIRRAADCAGRIWRAGFAAICPHLNTRRFGGITYEDSFIEGYKQILRLCDAVIVLPRWSYSVGAVGEIKEAIINKIPVFNDIEDFIGGRFVPEETLRTLAQIPSSVC